MESFVAALPLKQRLALIQRKYHELSYADIATNLGSSEAAARASVHEALRKLRTASATGSDRQAREQSWSPSSSSWPPWCRRRSAGAVAHHGGSRAIPRAPRGAGTVKHGPRGVIRHPDGASALARPDALAPVRVIRATIGHLDADLVPSQSLFFLQREPLFGQPPGGCLTHFALAFLTVKAHWQPSRFGPQSLFGNGSTQ